jgi:glycosyltransferase involved in cell wall biosynthesis
MRAIYISEKYTTHDQLFLEAFATLFDSISFLRLTNSDTPCPLHQITEVYPSRRPDYLHPDAISPVMVELEEAVRSASPDMIIAGPVQTAGLCATLINDYPTVILSWGSDILRDADMDPQMLETTRYVLDRADLFIADCDAVRMRAQELSSTLHNIVQFPWGVDLERFHPPKQARQRDHTKFNIIHTRSFETIYNVENLIIGFAVALRKAPRLVLSLLGGGSLENRIKELVIDLGVQESIIFHGRVAHEELPAMFRNADAYISASLFDGSSISLLEAMATGLPVVVSDIPGNREWIHDNLNGFLFNPEEPEFIAQQLLATQSLSTEQRSSIAANNRKICTTKASWSKNREKMLQALTLMANK